MTGLRPAVLDIWSRVSILPLVGLPLMGLLAGCGPRGDRHALDRDVAVRSLTRFFDEWKAGGTAASLQAGDPAVVGKDPDWDAGRKLDSWTLVDSSFSDGVNLHAVVRLKLASGAGDSREREITYLVGTSPVITIFRD